MKQQAYEQLREGRFEEAVETFSVALSLCPQEVEALRGRGWAYAELNRWTLAEADFRQAKEAVPENVDYGIDWANSLAMDNQVYRAIEVFEELLARQPDCLRAHLELGRLHFRLGAIPKGRQCLQHALRCRPSGAQRQRITATLQEQDRLDRKRYYRPDFEALNRQRQQQQGGIVHYVRRLLSRWRS